MVLRRTQKPITVTLEKARKVQLDNLVDLWSMDQKKFLLQALREYSPSAKIWQRTKDWFLDREKEISHLTDEEIFKSPNARYKITGEQNPAKALHKIFDREITADDRNYLIHVLKQETDDTYVPPELIEIFTLAHKRHLQKALPEEKKASEAPSKKAPKAPFYLFVGSSGSGKTKTINEAIERALFDQRLIIKQRVPDDLEKILEERPVIGRLDLATASPEIAERMENEKRKKRLMRLAKIPLIRRIYRNDIAEVMEKDDEEFGMEIDIDQVNPHNVQSKWYAQPGKNVIASFGSKSQPTIRIFEEVHALLGVHENLGAEIQEDNLIASFNITMDEIERGERPCIVVALTSKGDEFHQDVYRRFQEKGEIIDMDEYWKKPAAIEELIQREAAQQGLEMPDDEELKQMTEKIMQIFEYRGLDLTPAYVRKLLSCIIDVKEDLKPEYLDDGILVKEAFVNVARNLYPEMFRKTYNRMARNDEWDDYVGDIKEDFQQLVNKCLRYDLSAIKGAVLSGPPGVGKTMLVKTYSSRHKDIPVIAPKMDDLQDERDPINGPAKKYGEVVDIARMCAPCVLFIDEGDDVAMERQGNIGDRLTNKFLSETDGSSVLKGVFIVITTNKPEHLAEAVTRSKRLKHIPVTGKLNEQEIYQMVDNHTRGEEFASDLSKENVYTVAQRICSTPADYSEFFETLVGSKNEERAVIKYVSKLEDDKDINKFIRFNYKVVLGLVKSLGFPKEFTEDAKNDISFLLENKQGLMEKIKEAAKKDHYPLTPAHLERAREEKIKTPKVKSRVALEDFLESQLSEEPQVGFVIGAAADDVRGVMLPIATTPIYDKDYRGDKTIVTGAVNVENAAKLNAAVEMMKQSSNEALALVFNYLDSLLPKKDAKRIIGAYLNDWHLHHQFLTVGYLGGGPSAGMALAINTLSVILDLPVRNDFGITGAPGSRGKTKKDVGSSVIIGSTHNKSQNILNYLDRMYIPDKNLEDIDPSILDDSWKKGKDIIAYEHFPSIMGEVYCWNPSIEEQVKQLFKKRIEAKQQELAGKDGAQELLQEVDELSSRIRNEAENIVRQRIGCIERYLLHEDKDIFASPEQIFEKYKE